MVLLCVDVVHLKRSLQFEFRDKSRPSFTADQDRLRRVKRLVTVLNVSLANRACVAGMYQRPASVHRLESLGAYVIYNVVVHLVDCV